MTNALKKRMIRELRKILYDHPRYRLDSNNVQNKFSFEERPQRGIIVNNASADQVKLSADNFMGVMNSFVMLTNVENKSGNTLEWAHENALLLGQYSPRRDIFPSPPGVYILEVTRLPDDAHSVPGLFTIEPFLFVENEPLITFSSSSYFEAQLTHDCVYPGSLRLWLNNRRALLPTTDFSVDYETGAVTFLRATPTGGTIHADYYYKIESQGPFPFDYEASNETAIPGTVLAFGDRAELGDQMAIKIGSRRREVANVFGGKFETTFEL